MKQNTWDYSENLNKLKPDYLIHGDDWKKGIPKKTRGKVINLLKKWNGKLIEVPYTKQPEIKESKKNMQNIIFNPENRVSRLARLIKSKKIVKFIESHNPLTGLMIENLKINYKNEFKEFDGIWSSSLTDSAQMENQTISLSN